MKRKKSTNYIGAQPKCFQNEISIYSVLSSEYNNDAYNCQLWQCEIRFAANIFDLQQMLLAKINRSNTVYSKNAIKRKILKIKNLNFRFPFHNY